MGYSAFSAKGAGINYVPLTGTEPGAVLAILCNGDMTDLAGDADFSVTGSDFETGASYDGLRDAIKLNTPGLRTTSGTDHQVPIASAITYGGMFFIEYDQASTPFLIASASGVLATEQNYGVRFNPGGGTAAFQPVPAGQSFANAEVARWAWMHVMVTENAGRTSQSLYVNGSLVDTLVSANIGVAAAADDFNLGSNDGVANTTCAGLATDIFVADQEYTAAQVRALAENAFGHALP